MRLNGAAILTARYGVPVGNDGEFFIFTDWTYLGETNFLLYESREFNADSRFEGGLRVGYAGGNGEWGNRRFRPEHHRRG